MLKLGEKQKLIISERKDFGVYLKEAEGAEKVLLPIKQLPEGCGIGDGLEVFLYRDSQDRIIATTAEPLIKKGEVRKLTVKEVGKIGAFLDWGLEKDLLLPFKEQTAQVTKGDKVLVTLYIDKSSRLCASMKVYPFLEKATGIKKDDKITGTVYEISKNFGAFVAIDDRFTALIPRKEMTGDLKVGQTVEARVTGVKEDGKVDLSIREKSYVQMSIDADRLVKYLESHEGVIPFTDKASPELIMETMSMSKNEFKRAVGNLLKMGKIEIKPESIVWVQGK